MAVVGCTNACQLSEIGGLLLVGCWARAAPQTAAQSVAAPSAAVRCFMPTILTALAVLPRPRCPVGGSSRSGTALWPTAAGCGAYRSAASAAVLVNQAPGCAPGTAVDGVQAKTHGVAGDQFGENVDFAAGAENECAHR